MFSLLQNKVQNLYQSCQQATSGLHLLCWDSCAGTVVVLGLLMRRMESSKQNNQLGTDLMAAIVMQHLK